MRVADTTTIATYTLEVRGIADRLEALALKCSVGWMEILSETEENLSDLLPPGFSVRIKEWDAE